MKLLSKSLLVFALLGFGTAAALADTYTGDVTAVNVNPDNTGTFTVLGADSKIKIFSLPPSPKLAVGQHVTVHYRNTGKWPLDTRSVDNGQPGGDFPGGS